MHQDLVVTLVTAVKVVPEVPVVAGAMDHGSVMMLTMAVQDGPGTLANPAKSAPQENGGQMERTASSAPESGELSPQMFGKI